MYSPVRQREYNKRAKHMANSGRQEIINSASETINRQRMQILKLKAFVLSVSVILEHRCPSCDAIDVVEKALKELEIHEEELNAST